MKDKELRKLIGSRAKQRRLELNLTQPYVAEKMGVTASTILRYLNLLILFLTAFGVIFNSSEISLISYSKNLNNNIFNKIALDFFNLYNKLSFSI